MLNIFGWNSFLWHVPPETTALKGIRTCMIFSMVLLVIKCCKTNLPLEHNTTVKDALELAHLKSMFLL